MFRCVAINFFSLFFIIVISFTNSAIAEMNKKLFCKDGIYQVTLSGGGKDKQRLKNLRQNINAYVGAKIVLIGHWFPYQKIETSYDYVDGSVSSLKVCSFTERNQYALAEWDDRVITMLYKEDFLPVPEGFEKLKKMLLRNTEDSIASRNVFKMQGSVEFSNTHNVAFIRITEITPLLSWEPTKR